MCCCISAIGNSAPPVYIFPRVKYKQFMLKGAPPQSLGLASRSDIFPQALAHFFKFMNATPENPSILFLDNHVSHLSIEAVALAREKGVYMITFPPKCSHKMQPLDIAVYGPFKRFYASFCNAWLTLHSSSTISIYEIAEISGKAYESACTMKNITSGFKATGICPFNPHVFSEDEFLPAAVLPAAVTNFPLIENAADEPGPDISSVSLDASTSSLQPQTCVDDISLLEDIRPYPKAIAGIVMKRRRTDKVKSAVITSTPE